MAWDDFLSGITDAGTKIVESAATFYNARAKLEAAKNGVGSNAVTPAPNTTTPAPSTTSTNTGTQQTLIPVAVGGGKTDTAALLTAALFSQQGKQGERLVPFQQSAVPATNITLPSQRQGVNYTPIIALAAVAGLAIYSFR